MRKFCEAVDEFIKQADCKQLTLMKLLLCCVSFFLGLSAPKKGKGLLKFLSFCVGVASVFALFPDFRAIKEKAFPSPLSEDMLTEEEVVE